MSVALMQVEAEASIESKPLPNFTPRWVGTVQMISLTTCFVNALHL